MFTCLTITEFAVGQMAEQTNGKKLPAEKISATKNHLVGSVLLKKEKL